ncbi:hypothetical protein [Agathobacter rectalis]|uniref:hypothetical protein n=1 Tax=Agathobacter rectalis TaxID=39491 RepID=UPI0027D31B23|nr:hypothetical protein [Agathobacter rectalis]MCB7108427.1 hypothetical protein [Agathobacter rectalis]MCG4811694.1 hypothetical protein [Agathobacter rectalis]
MFRRKNKNNQNIIRNIFFKDLLIKLEQYKENARPNASKLEILLSVRNLRYIYNKKWENERINNLAIFNDKINTECNLKTVNFSTNYINEHDIRKEYVVNILNIYKSYFNENKNDITMAESEFITQAMNNVIELYNDLKSKEK